MKAITPVIAVILLLLITISMVGFAFVFLGRTTETAAESGEQQLEQQTRQLTSAVVIESANGNKVYVRNTGSSELTSLSFYADGEQKQYSGPASLAPNAVGEYTLQDFSAEATTVIRVTSGGFGDRIVNPMRSCKGILAAGRSNGDGVYTIEPSGSQPFQVYCDMTTEGGGWTLVLLNSPNPTPPKPSWNDVVNSNNVQGNINGGLTAFDQLLGVKYWNTLGSTLRVEVGQNPTTINDRATYTFSLNVANNYALSMSNQNIQIGSTAPGMYTYHAANNLQLSTFDADHDVHTGNCATSYSNTAWWYGACWDGNFWGGGDADGHTNNPYWTGSGGDYYPWGAIWIR